MGLIDKVKWAAQKSVADVRQSSERAKRQGVEHKARDAAAEGAESKLVNWRIVPPAIVVILLLGWSCSEAVDRQEWFTESSASKAMAKARFKCDESSFYDSGGAFHREYVDPDGNAFVATDSGSGAAGAALNECAQANLGPDAVPPVNWRKVIVVGGVLLGLASIPWIYWRLRNSGGGPHPDVT